MGWVSADLVSNGGQQTSSTCPHTGRPLRTVAVTFLWLRFCCEQLTLHLRSVMLTLR